ncbi:MAG: FAD-dependent oxidoreductase, partial [Pseudomonadota bacterium]
MARPFTRKRDLRTGTPVWLPHGEVVAPPQPLERGFRVDVAVIGGGVSGALMADAALQAGRSVAVFDRRGLVRGSTPASTALLQFELDQPLTTLSGRIGADRAARAWWRSAGAVQHLRGRIEDLGLRCRLKPRASAYLPGNTLDVAGLRAEATARERIGLRSAFIGRDALLGLTGIHKAGAVWSPDNAELDPVRLVRGLWRSALARGARIFAPVELVDLQAGRDNVTLTMADGLEVTAKHVVLATGYELTRLLKPTGYKVITTWAMATAPQRDKLWGTRCLIWEAADPYLYLRTTADDRI